MVSRHFRTAHPVVLDARVVTGTGGGPDKTILNSPRFLTPLGYRMLCAYMHPPDDPGFDTIRDKARRWDAPLADVPDRGPLDCGVFTRMLELCRRERVAIWHGHDYKSNLLGILLKAFWPMRLVTTVHGWVEQTGRNPLYFALDRLCLPRYELVLAVSEDLRRESIHHGVRPRRCLLLENGIDTIEFSRRRTRAEAKAELGFPTGRLLIGAAGRLSVEKGFDLLIRAVDLLLRRGKDVGLVIVGEGGQREELQALVAKLGRGDRIRLAGYQGDPRPFYEAMDGFALSSLREGLPNVLLEAMAMETPVVATRIAGVPGVVEDGVNGLLVEPGSADALADGLVRLIDDADLRKRFSLTGRQTIESRYSFASRMGRLAGLYDRLLRRKKMRTPTHRLAP